MKVFFGLMWIALLYSCSHDNLVYDKPYFDFDSLVHTQLLKLGSSNVKLMKKTSLNGKKDSTNFVPDTTQWKHELDAFQQLDVINKPLFKNNYVQNDSEDDHSNLLVRSYSARIKSPVPLVKFFYQAGFKKLRRIEAVFAEGNVLYATSRKLTLDFDDQQGLFIIARYSVHGIQKMIMSDSVKFSIEGKLIFP
jgi:hypothetical protein